MLRRIVPLLAAFVIGLIPILGARVTDHKRSSWRVDKVFLGPSVFGDTYYVDATLGAAGNTGLYPGSAKKTIAQAIAAASAGDTVVLAPGTHSVDVSAAALVPKADMTFIAAVPSLGGAPNVIIVADADDGADLITVDVDGVSFHDIEFRLVAGGTTALRLLSVAQTTAVRGLHIMDCWFNVNSVDAASVFACAFNDATNAITGLVMKGCRFIGGDATTNASIYVSIGVGGLPDALIQDNTFVLESADGDALALNFADPGAAGGSYGIRILDNDFIGPKDGGGDASPIVFAAGMTEDEVVGMIRGNFFSNCVAQPITIDKVNNSIINNYAGDDDTGGTLVDPGT